MSHVKEMTEKKTHESLLTFESALEKLQGIVKRLEAGELSLEDSLKNFEEGVQLTRFCQEQLTAVERKIELLSKESADGKIDLQPFSHEKAN